MNLTLRLRFVFSCTQPRSNFLACWIHRLVCVHPNQIQWFLACILALLHRDNFVHTLRMYPINLDVSQPTQDLLASILRRLIILKRVFWYWACNFFNCIQLIILFELFTMRLQNRCNQFREDTYSTTQSASQDSSSFSPKLPAHALQSSSPRLRWFSNCL